MRGRFIVLEGMDGAGKSTHARLLGRRLNAMVTQEPGSGRIGARIRGLLLDPANDDLSDRAEALLMAADRAQHIASIVRPAIEAGRTVVSDRYLYSSVAYQGHGRGLDPGEIRSLSLWASQELEPDVVVFLDIGDAQAERRLGAGRDRLESVGADFRRRVLAGYRAQIDAEPERWLAVDASGSVDETARLVFESVADRLNRLTTTP